MSSAKIAALVLAAAAAGCSNSGDSSPPVSTGLSVGEPEPSVSATDDASTTSTTSTTITTEPTVDPTATATAATAPDSTDVPVVADVTPVPGFSPNGIVSRFVVGTVTGPRPTSSRGSATSPGMVRPCWRSPPPNGSVRGPDGVQIAAGSVVDESDARIVDGLLVPLP